MKFGLPISVIFHVCLVLGGMIVWSKSKPQTAETGIIPLTLMTVSDVTDIKPQSSKPQKREPDQKPTPETKPSTTPTPTPKPSAKPEPKSNPSAQPSAPDTKPRAPAFDLDALEQALGKAAQGIDAASEQKPLGNEHPNIKPTDQDRVGAGARQAATVSAVDYIRSRMHNCWFVDQGALDFQSLVIEVSLTLEPNGQIRAIVVNNDAQIIASANQSWGVARHNAVTALRKCAPYDGLLSIDYDIWKELRLRLDPGEEK